MTAWVRWAAVSILSSLSPIAFAASDYATCMKQCEAEIGKGHTSCPKMCSPYSRTPARPLALQLKAGPSASGPVAAAPPAGEIRVSAAASAPNPSASAASRPSQ